MTAPHTREHLEDRHSVWLLQWARYTRIQGEDIIPVSHLADYLLHIPNGGKRAGREAARFKALGVKAGVSDYFLPLARAGYHGLWIELKRPKIKGNYPSITDKQQAWIQRMHLARYDAMVAYGWQEAANRITGYLGLPA
ncbi:MAG: VRR-NUC domain-containing protein, partial [Gammaproteobacteria bacterium]